MELVPFILPVHAQLSGMGGTHNGYVAIPKEHPYFGKKYDDIDGIDVHGGITFAGKFKAEFLPESLKDKAEEIWVFGFDTLHHGDHSSYWNESRVMNETLSLKEQLESVL